ncbi:MAG: peptidoglycan-binding protein [Deltaproteobacteria bacterium]|nr:peptidoglycan-binding protein [Deltaproteobacteria bacterium]
MEHRLVVAGGRGNLKFSRGALKKIYAYSQGNPRRINNVCDRALLIAYTGEKHDISQGIIREAVREIRGDMRSEQSVNGWSLGRYAIYSILLLLLIMVAGLGGWSFRDSIRETVSVEPKIETLRKEFPPPIDLSPEERSSLLFLDEAASLSFLFTLYSSRTDKEGRGLNSHNLSLVQFDIAPEYYVLLKKPFRVCLPDHRDEESPTPYLLIRKITDEGAIVIDTEGEEQPVTREFILEHWGQKVSWVYPTRNKNPVLFKGMRAPDVLELQSIFNKLGYLVQPTGIYDGETFQVTMRFQKEFGLLADGIAGPRTRALLYQMVN